MCAFSFSPCGRRCRASGATNEGTFPHNGLGCCLRKRPLIRPSARRAGPPSPARGEGREQEGDMLISRSDRGLLASWWFTVDRLLLSAVLLLMAAGVLISMAASPPVAQRIGLDA